MNATVRQLSLSALVAAAATLSLAPAAYADTSDPVQAALVGGKTRAQVLAELQAARANGDLVVSIAGLKAYELTPDRYPSHAAPNVKTRQQVRAELADAQRSGDLLANGESGLKLKELEPQRYAQQAPAAVGASHAVAAVGQPASAH